MRDLRSSCLRIFSLKRSRRLAFDRETLEPLSEAARARARAACAGRFFRGPVSSDTFVSSGPPAVYDISLFSATH
jgi:hypothetical protein